jgi:hypothetical protein
VLQKTSKCLLVVLLTLSIGAHWGVLQSVAWMGMAFTYAQKAPLKEALIKTFDGQHPCNLCKFVQKGKTSEQKQESKLDLKKKDFFNSSVAAFYFSPLPAISFAAPFPSPQRTEPPSLPPPRIA